MIEEMLFQSWSGILRTLLVGTLAYAGLVAFLRISGKRTLAKLNAFDLVVTVALGSTLATILLSESVALAEGLTAFVTLIALQYLVAKLSVASDGFARLVRSEPTLLMHEGRVLQGALRRERITEEELISAIRTNSGAARKDVAAVVLESDGSFSVIPKPGDGGGADYASADLPKPHG
ncbi:DUF421 domain-containing protein [Limimaricola pyoseonensis]|uniref:DUF421 domain-containing protein n=1 Tax=Limimaricola pyoseonensis TaxID=521013 RepID=A0A1G7CXU8_9RHOB|nr:YetF domain-containing protein [Limimaricola pyoseonensis]SDE44081.1 Protein of unknown function [Limimaricola pyoseonensis]